MKKLLTVSFISLLLTGQAADAQTSQLWGTTFRGGTRDSGVIFKINADGSGFAKADTFYSKGGFCGYSRLGGIPLGSLLQASNGKIYAVNSEASSYAHNHFGSLFSYDLATHYYSDVHDFKLTEGAVPQGSLIQAKDGKLYGVTSWGGTHNYGVIFSLDLSNNIYSDLYNLDSANGFYPKGRLMQAKDGKLYGMTEYGGANNAGVIFSFNVSDSSYKKLADFNGDNGKHPTGNLVQADNGLLYGMTGSGGKFANYPGGNGVIFCVDPVSGTFSLLHDLDSTNGVNPAGSLILANGKLYGMAFQGGANNNGALFCYDPLKNTFAKLYDFDGAHGGGPNGTLTLVKGKLFGTASWGGVNADGVLFSFDPATKAYKDLFDFDGVNGTNPFGDLIEVITKLGDTAMGK